LDGLLPLIGSPPSRLWKQPFHPLEAKPLFYTFSNAIFAHIVEKSKIALLELLYAITY
jgi:hypothetical protein